MRAILRAGLLVAGAATTLAAQHRNDFELGVFGAYTHFDPAFNLRVGQDYFTWLMERALGGGPESYDVLRAVAAYNAGAGTVLNTLKKLGGGPLDSLLVMESLPALETRDYVEKVMVAYWTYKRRFGGETNTLDAVARGDRIIDLRLDK